MRALGNEVWGVTSYKYIYHLFLFIIRYSKFESLKKKAIIMSILKPEIQIFKTPCATFVEKTMLVLDYYTLWPLLSFPFRSVMNKPC